MLAFFALGLWVAFFQLAQGNADFLSVRTSQAENHSGNGDHSRPKYFYESDFHYHYDGRFASKQIHSSQRIPHLTVLVQSYLSTMADIGVETWIMHGTLLGWFWNRKILPWDSDIDVQVSETTMHFLAQYYNMTEYSFRVPESEDDRTFLLEINPRFVIRSDDKMNVIDARWIDTSTGLFIDITGVRKDFESRKQGKRGALMCKDRHRFDERDIYPLRNSLFEGHPVKIPFDYTKLLVDEYGNSCLTKTTFRKHKFNDQWKIWEPIPQPPKPVGQL